MRKTFWCISIVHFLVLLQAITFAQEDHSGIRLESITLHGNYLRHFSLKSGEGLHEIHGFGGGAHLRFRLSRILSFGLSGGYADLEIEQDDAVNRWNWGFWERFYRNYVRDLQQRDPNYIATLTPHQRLQMVPVFLTTELYLPMLIGVKPSLQLGGSLYRYKRTLTLHERWEKRFPELSYTYTYEFDNHAENRTGTVFGLVGGLGGRGQLFRSIELNMQGRYHWILPTEKRDAYRYFPVRSFVEVLLGVVFIY